MLVSNKKNMNMKKIYLLLLLFCSTNLLGQIPTDSLVGFWKFNGNGIDGSIFNNHGTLINEANFNFDRFSSPNKALKLINNLQQYVTIPNNASLKADNELTISFWAKRTTFGSGVVDQVLNKGGDWNTGTCNYGLVFSDNTLLFLHNNGYHGIAVPGIPSQLLLPYNGPYGSTLPGSPQDTLWHHYVITTHNNSPIAYFYVDSVLVPTFYDGWGQNIVLNPNSNADLYIGGVNYFSNNILDDIRIYKKEITQSEVTALFNETCNTVNSFSVNACDSYTAPDNITYYSSGTITSVIPNAEGCDSVITISLTISTVDTIVNQIGNQLVANANGAIYQWLNCDSGYAIISEETNQSFIASQNGNYAVEITQNGCIDTSACFAVTTVGIFENTLSEGIQIYPNPTDGIMNIDLGKTMTEIVVDLCDVSGRLISQSKYKNTRKIEQNLTLPSGIYLLTINSENKKAVIKIIKK